MVGGEDTSRVLNALTEELLILLLLRRYFVVLCSFALLFVLNFRSLLREGGVFTRSLALTNELLVVVVREFSHVRGLKQVCA